MNKMNKKFKLEPCPNCESSNILIYNCGYSSFNAGHVECKDCKWKVDISGLESDASFAYEWNRCVKQYHIKAKADYRRKLEASYCINMTNEEIVKVLKDRDSFEEIK